MKDWYKHINTLCHKLGAKYGYKPEVIAGILVELSAQKQWKENVTQTIHFLKGKKLTGMFSKKQLDNCQEILNGKDPLTMWAKTSQKYRNFYGSILLQPDACCIDSHMINIYLEEHPYSRLFNITKAGIFKSRRAYEIIQKWVRKGAEENNMLPYEYQAVLWVNRRGKTF